MDKVSLNFWKREADCSANMYDTTLSSLWTLKLKTIDTDFGKKSINTFSILNCMSTVSGSLFFSFFSLRFVKGFGSNYLRHFFFFYLMRMGLINLCRQTHTFFLLCVVCKCWLLLLQFILLLLYACNKHHNKNLFLTNCWSRLGCFVLDKKQKWSITYLHIPRRKYFLSFQFFFSFFLTDLLFRTNMCFK